MATKLVVNTTTNRVENVVVFEEGGSWAPPDGTILLDPPSGGSVGMHWVYDPANQTFSEPPEWSQV